MSLLSRLWEEEVRQMDLEARIVDKHWRVDLSGRRCAFGLGPDGELWHNSDPQVSDRAWCRASNSTARAWHIDGHTVRREPIQ